MSVSVIRSGVNRLLTRSPEHEQTALHHQAYGSGRT